MFVTGSDMVTISSFGYYKQISEDSSRTLADSRGFTSFYPRKTESHDIKCNIVESGIKHRKKTSNSQSISSVNKNNLYKK